MNMTSTTHVVGVTPTVFDHPRRRYVDDVADLETNISWSHWSSIANRQGARRLSGVLFDSPHPQVGAIDRVDVVWARPGSRGLIIFMAVTNLVADPMAAARAGSGEVGETTAVEVDVVTTHRPLCRCRCFWL